MSHVRSTYNRVEHVKLAIQRANDRTVPSIPRIRQRIQGLCHCRCHSILEHTASVTTPWRIAHASATRAHLRVNEKRGVESHCVSAYVRSSRYNECTVRSRVCQRSTHVALGVMQHESAREQQVAAKMTLAMYLHNRLVILCGRLAHCMASE